MKPPLKHVHLHVADDRRYACGVLMRHPLRHSMEHSVTYVTCARCKATVQRALAEVAP